VSAGVELIACETCGSSEPDGQGRTRGEQLIALLRQHASPPVTIVNTRCLWACTRSCAVHLRSPGRVGYVIATLEPNEEHARALVDYAQMYGQTSDGAVPLRERPAALRGHFLCRVPALPGPLNEGTP
jgi:predicted metal-binding protein